jgi:TonB family protein
MRKHNKHITREELQRYLRGEMSNEQMHEFERKASEDSFLSDAMEGYEDMLPNNLDRDLDNLDFHMQETFLKDAPEVKSSPFSFMKVAATILLVMCFSAIGYFLYYGFPEDIFRGKTITMSEEQKDKAATEKQEKKVSEEEILEVPEQDVEAGLVTAPDRPKEQRVASETLDEIVTETETLDEGAGDVVLEEQSTPPPTETKEEETEMLALDLEAGVEEEPDSEDTDALAGISLTNTIQGQVISASDNQPIYNADVGLLNTNERTKTNENGEFSIETTGSGETIVAYADGYNSNTSGITDDEKITIQLHSAPLATASRMALRESQPDRAQPAALQESEVGKQKKAADAAATIEAPVPSNSIPVPEIPMVQYQQYLHENLEYPPQAAQNGIQGKVILELSVDANGTITNIFILLGLGYGCDEEATRVVREGPGWQPAIINGTPTSTVTQLAVQFSLD